MLKLNKDYGYNSPIESYNGKAVRVNLFGPITGTVQISVLPGYSLWTDGVTVTVVRAQLLHF